MSKLSSKLPKRVSSASKKQKRAVNKAKNMRIHGKVKKSAVSHKKPVAKMHTEMAKMIDPSFRVGVV